MAARVAEHETCDAPVVRVPPPLPAGAIGPCLRCQCNHVDVNLLTNFMRYCQCPQCGNAWTEPARYRPVHAEFADFQSEALKFVRDRN